MYTSILIMIASLAYSYKLNKYIFLIMYKNSTIPTTMYKIKDAFKEGCLEISKKYSNEL